MENSIVHSFLFTDALKLILISSSIGRNIPNLKTKVCYIKFSFFGKNFHIIHFFYKKVYVITLKIPKVTFTLTKEPPWNNEFLQSFSRNIQFEKCFRIVRKIVTKPVRKIVRLIKFLRSIFKIQQKPRDRAKV